MRLQFNNGKFSVDPTMGYSELSIQSPLVATLASFDMPHSHQDLTYTIVDGCFYGVRRDTRSGDEWFYFDPSVRKWSACEKPEEV